ncbi:hypothetical protein NP493_839g01054 [Ridgeia piscesae]|uniref:Uncharacterized protein n=1 Tax=Ridgeia piscesae TaxID=27915 RepID=A0AAD9NMF8_RIDPI|nr:hypothetical protein NP493_839g01054 [Ridgeia piscesae]
MYYVDLRVSIIRTSSPTSRCLKWLRLPASRPCSSKHSFAGQDMSPGWETIAYQRSYYMENCPLAIVTKGHLGKIQRNFEKVPRHLQHRSPLVDKTSNRRDAQSTRPPLPLTPHEGPMQKTKGESEKTRSVLEPTLSRRAAAVERLAYLG